MTASQTILPDDESPRRALIRRILTTIVIIACLAGLVVAAQRTRRGDEADAPVTGAPPDVVQMLAPTPDSSVLSQAQILIGLDVRYTAQLSVNGVPIPATELQKSEATVAGQVIYTPGEGKVLERLPAGRNCVEATITRVDGGAENLRPVRWCFNVT